MRVRLLHHRLGGVEPHVIRTVVQGSQTWRIVGGLLYLRSEAEGEVVCFFSRCGRGRQCGCDSAICFIQKTIA